MTLTKDVNGLSKTYEGPNGIAVLTRNFGNRDKVAKWSLSVTVNGEYKDLGRRIEFQKAYAMAEAMIG